MAGRGGAQAPDYAPRPAPGPGAAANRSDMSDGRHAGPGTTPISGAPTPPVTGTGGAYGQRQELRQLAAGAPMRPGAPPGGGGGAPIMPPELVGPGEVEPSLPLMAPLPPAAMAAYTPADIRGLEQLLPTLRVLAMQPDASEAILDLFDLVGEVVLHGNTPREPVTLGTDPALDFALPYTEEG